MFLKPFLLASLNTCLVFGYKRWNLMPMFRDLFLTSSTHTGVGSVIMCALVCHFENVLHNRPCDKFAFTKEAKTCEVVTLTRHYGPVVDTSYAGSNRPQFRGPLKTTSNGPRSRSA